MSNKKSILLIKSNNEFIWLGLLLCVTFCLFLIGVFSPMITLTKFLIIENTFSVYSGVIELLKEGKYFLFFVITCFSLVLPVLKMGVLLNLLITGKGESQKIKKFLHWIHLYGKWSMLDVFVVAILVVVVKLGPVASVEMHYGLYFFAGSVILTMILTARVVSLMNNQNKVTNSLDESEI